MRFEEKIEKVSRELEEYDKYTKNKRNWLMFLHEEAIYIGVISSLAVALLFSILEALELFCKTHGVTGYAFILVKGFILLMFVSIYTHRVHYKRYKKHKSQKLEETDKKH